MFVGHTALALAAKTRAPRTSLGLLFAAAMGLDLLWPPFLLLGLERVSIEPGATPYTPLVFESYPWSHSLLMAAVWGGLLAVVSRRWTREARAPVLLSALVVSHWFLDMISHGPDMPVWPGHSPLLGLGLWNSIPATLVVEGGIFCAGIYLYLRTTSPVDRAGSIGLWAWLLVQGAMWASTPWVPSPPSPGALAGFSLGLWLFVVWAWWVDAHRQPRTAGG
jgi:hypothetical protein